MGYLSGYIYELYYDIIFRNIVINLFPIIV